ncbi:MAG: hypothetical protein GY705_01610 [Bacteroidetes bacterium]|nr:hypothetical protein [Bacteroidota bacterium]
MKENNPDDYYDKVFQKAISEQQTVFLRQLFEKDSDLRAQFNNFIAYWETEKEKEVAPILSFVNLDELQEEVREELNGMHFHYDDVFDYFEQDDRSYVPEYEAAWEGA